MKTVMRYEGFTVSSHSRDYQFWVSDPEGEPRRFSVRVPLDSFRSTSLKFQDAPLLAQERLARELELESPARQAAALVPVMSQDVLSYLERHYPPGQRKVAKTSADRRSFSESLLAKRTAPLKS